MALLLETTYGDLVIDLDIEGSPELCRNLLKLAKARYFTSNLIYNVQPQRFCQTGDPTGTGSGGGCIYGLLDTDDDITKSTARFLKSKGRVLSSVECQEKGRVVATEMNGIPDTVGSQFLITLEGGPQRALDGYIPPHAHDVDDYQPRYLSLGVVTEDASNVLDKIHDAYCDANGRPYADVRIERALVVYDPFDDPPGLQELMEKRGVEFNSDENVVGSPSYERPLEETAEIRISANQVDEEEDDEADTERAKQREEEIHKKEDKSRAVVLEMLGDLPSADIKAPENVLFVCKLNPITEDEDLELIFSRFDEKVKVEIIRDAETGASLQYAFCEFTTKEKCVEAYFKMNGALVDDRRIKVDFSQSVAKIWDRYNQKLKPQRLQAGDLQSTSGGLQSSGGSHRGGRGGGRDNHRRNGPRSGEIGERGQSHYRRNDPWFDRRERPSPRRDVGQSRNDEPLSSSRRDDRFGGNRDDRDRFGDHDRGYHRRHNDSSRGYHNGDGYRDERRRHGRNDYSPRRDRDDHGRQRRSRSPSPDRSRDHKRRKHSSKHHRRERSSHDGDRDDRRRRHSSEYDDKYNTPSRDDYPNDRLHGSGGREDGDERDERRRDGDSSSRKRHRNRHDNDERKHRKKHHRNHRDRDDRDEHRLHKKRKHKERRSRSRS